MIDPYYVQEDDYLDDMKFQLKRALGLTEDDLRRLSPEARNLFSARRKLGHTWLDDYEIVVEVTSSPGGCGCGVAEGQKIVFDMRHKVKPELSDAPLCVHLMSPALSIFYMTFDRAAEGLNPLTCVWRYLECPMTGSDHGASKARCEVHMRRVDTHERVTDRILAKPEVDA
ncbi:hypothetical protein [Rhizobium sp. EC-SD404]|uniref:hypothetical protein n=1 Tax=Rhizobium sp. EC-SD404 TaxID=2038389 RepID=UPI001252BA5C|nr:hypothetical protein [Rhizobium sp. EC-SD404]VVT26708.1 conserved hypothetical protein [Rhizobium sp. EC-SD404]